MAHIYVEHSEGVTEVHMPAGVPLAEPLRQHGLLHLPCGGGRCGKCRIYAHTTPSQEEEDLLEPALLRAGLRLACYTRAMNGLRIRIPQAAPTAVLTDMQRASYPWEPAVRSQSFSIPLPSLEDQRGDLEALMEAVGAQSHALTLEQLAALPAYRRSCTQGYALLSDNTLLGLRRHSAHLGMVIDIGTTTVAALLVDLDTRQMRDAVGEHNAQAAYGADVITRIHHSMEQGVEPLRTAITVQINRLMVRLIASMTENVDAPSLVVVTGNTTMLHLFCGLPPEHVGKAPFIPAMLGPLRSCALNFGLHTDAPLFVMPGISSYIGADITAALLAAGSASAPFLLLDLGTNAEIVLFAHGKFHACSAAAGPCFEGATLECGMAGQKGAIDKVFLRHGQLCFSVMGGGEPRGLCGSAVLDAVALLLDTGALDTTGRLEAQGPLASHIRDFRGHPALHFTQSTVLTQKDIREVQLAKAAVAAGVDILLSEAGLNPDAVDTLFLAGGFGSAMSPVSATRLGLFPRQLASRVTGLGNAAAAGALRYVTEAGAAAHALNIIRRTRHVELSVHEAFSMAYMEHMVFPEKHSVQLQAPDTD